MKQPKTVLVTGATSGIGRETALLLGRLGHRVIATGRNEEALGSLDADAAGLQVDVVRLDVTDSSSLRECGEEVERLVRGQGLDALVNNAGFGTMAPLEVADEAEVRAQFETNVFGLLRTTQRFLPAMRARGAGMIINVSSVVGRVTLPLQGAYCATKHAVEALSDALRMEVAPFGVKVVLVEPGSIRTRFEATATSTTSRYYDSPYGPAVEAYGPLLAKTYRYSPGPQIIARAVAKILCKRRPAARYVIPRVNLLLVWLLALFPQSWSDAVMRRIMGLTAKALLPPQGKP